MSKKLQRALITLDRDFLYYEQININKHPGVIVISVGSATPPHINKICEKLLKNMTKDFVKDALIKVTANKIRKMKEGKIVWEKKL
jgi:predicted nuclease of predicted toxin-antitoxin system